MNRNHLQELINISEEKYYCSNCNLIPEILRLDYDDGIIEFKYKNHGLSKLGIIDYFKKEIKFHDIQLNKKDTNFSNTTKLDKRSKTVVPSQNDLDVLKNKKNDLVEKIQIYEYLIKFTDTLIKTYKKYPKNDLICRSVINTVKCIKEKKIIKKNN